MVDVHETLALYPHYNHKAVQGSAISPGSVDSPNSVYSNNERPDDNMSDNGGAQTVEPFVKIRPHSNGNLNTQDPLTFEINNSFQRSLSSDATHTNRPISPFHANSPKDRVKSSTPSFQSLNRNQTNAIVAMASGVGLPTMISKSVMLPSNMSPIMAMQQQQFHQESNSFDSKRNQVPSSQATNSYNPSARGIIGSSAGLSRSSPSPSPEDRAQYKRPPHTYPALIASAILDSPGHLITLRGIYDYIMNHFPYYKYCHDKSAWQNSIRHNLSLNQCFVKVPRYENAAKSNYWTMTREGFEEFGNENSFKRRRRRGAALAPISAYKAKKYQNEAKTNKNKPESRNHTSGNISSRTNSTEEASYSFPSQLVGLPGAWGPILRTNENSTKSRKRSHSPLVEGGKHPRMLVLKQGDGPHLGDIKTDDQKRPSSLSSVEEMQGTINSFNKSLLDSSLLSKVPPPLLAPSTQPWIAAAQKSLMASSGMLMSSLLPTDTTTSPGKQILGNSTSQEGYKGSENSIMMEGIEIGSELTLRYDTAEVPTRHIRCHFCPYTYVSTSETHLEQHVRMFHQVEMNDAKSKVAAAASTKLQNGEESKDAQERLSSLQHMVSGLSPQSMVAACQSNAQNLLAAAQVNASNVATGFPYSGTFPASILDDSVMRSIAGQVSVSQVNTATDNGLGNMEAFAIQRQQALNTALQQAATASTSPAPSPDQLRLFYQQLAMQSPFLANSTNSFSAYPRPIPTSTNQNLWQYQQKLYNQMKEALFDNTIKSDSVPSRRNSQSSEKVVTSRQNSSSTCKSPATDVDADSDGKKSIHGWKQCFLCDFTAKGDHGLDLHYRKVHAESDHNGVPTPPSSERKEKEFPINSQATTPTGCDEKFEERCDSPLTSSAFPTPPLSNSPTYVKKHFAPLDLSGAKEEELQKTMVSMVTTSTQTAQEAQAKDASSESRTCPHCNIVFGDDMMHALHMSCHDKANPFKCTICGQMCSEKYYFNVHLLRGLHQTNHNNSVHEPEVTQQNMADDVIGSLNRRCSNSSDVSTVTSRGRLNSNNSDSVSYQ